MKLSRPAAYAAVTLAAGPTLTACSSDDASTAVSDATSSAASVATSASEIATGPESEEALTSTPSAGAGTVVPGPDGPLVDVDPAITAKYVGRGGPASSLGDATGPQIPVGDGFSVPFEGGTIFTSPETGAYVVQGEILRVYTEQGGPTGTFGFPTNDETPILRGWSSTFTGGTITWTNESGEFAETLQPN